MKLTGLPQSVEDAVPNGEPILQAPMKPALTGRLTRSMQSSGESEIFKGRDVPIGTPVYATELGGELVWCAPKFNNGVWLSSTGNYCAIQRGTSWMAFSVAKVPFVTHGSVLLNIGTIDPPAVSLEAVDFDPPFRVGYAVTRWTEGRAVIQREILWDGKPYPYGCTFDIPRADDGSAELAAFGISYQLTPEADGRSTRVHRQGNAPPQAESLESGNCPASRVTGGGATYTRVAYGHHH